MRHLVHERLADLLVGLADEGVGIERKLMLAERPDAARIAVGGEVSRHPGFSLVRYKDIGQLAAEQLATEVIEPFLQAVVFDRRNGERLISRSFVRTTLHYSGC